MSHKITLRTSVLGNALERKLIKTLDINTLSFLKKCCSFQHYYHLKKFIELFTELKTKIITLKLVILKIWKEKCQWKYCKENYYKTLVLLKRKNANASESSENSSPPRSFEKKSLTKLAIKLIKTLVPIKALKRKTQQTRKFWKLWSFELISDSCSTFMPSTS